MKINPHGTDTQKQPNNREERRRERNPTSRQGPEEAPKVQHRKVHKQSTSRGNKQSTDPAGQSNTAGMEAGQGLSGRKIAL